MAVVCYALKIFHIAKTYSHMELCILQIEGSISISREGIIEASVTIRNWILIKMFSFLNSRMGQKPPDFFGTRNRNLSLFADKELLLSLPIPKEINS